MSLQIESLRMRSFGPFKDTTLDLGSGGGALHVICGPNEAGKTTTQRAIGDFIFGIPARTSDAHEFGFAEMRLEASVIDGKGVSHRLMRRKGNANTLLDEDGNPLDEGLLSEMLGGLTREAFASMFSITHQSLVDGGAALLAADGNLGESLFSASLGAAGLHELRRALDEEADKLFRPKATSTRIAKARSDLHAAEARLAAATLRATPYLKLAKEIDAAAVERRSIAEDLEFRRGEQLRRDRLRIVLPKAFDRAEATEELTEIGETPRLAPDSEERRLRIEQDLINHQRRSADAERRVESLTVEAAALRPDEDLLRREQAITDLAARLPVVAEAKVDLERQSTKVEVSKAAAERVLGELGRGSTPADPGRLKVGDIARAQVSAALQAHSRISGKLEEAMAEEAEATATVEDLERQVGLLEEPEDIAQLRAASEEVRPDSSLEAKVATVESKFEDATEDLRLALADLRPPAELDALISLNWPTASELAPFASWADDLDTRGIDLLRRKEDNTGEISDLEAAAPSTHTEALPDEEDLIERRSARDSLWSQARARLDGGEADEVDPDEYERRVQAADRIADLLREEADQLAICAQREERRAANAATGVRIEEEEERLTEERRGFAAQWEELWRPYGLEPRAPRDMEVWLTRRPLAVERSRAARQLERELESARALLTRHVSLLRSALGGATGTSALDSNATLGMLLALADGRISAAVEAADRRERLGRDLDTSRTEVEKHSRRATGRRTELESWQIDWRAITSNLGWPADIGPEEAAEHLERVVDLTNHLNRAEESEHRRQGIEKRIGQFEADVSALFGEIADADLSGRGHADAVAHFARRLEEAKEVRQRRADVEERLSVVRDDLAGALSDLTGSEADLSALMEQAGVADPADLAALEQRSERVRLLSERIPHLEEEIVAAGMEPLDGLLAACQDLDIDAFEARSKGAEEEIAQIEKTLGEVDVRIGTLESERRQMESAAPASASRQEVENLRAELASLTEDYLRIYVASWALGRAIDDYRRTHKAPLLARAEELFPRLTNGRYSELEVSFDAADQPVLVGVKADGKRLSVKEMSEGPREQLYLSLRQASIERHVERHGAVPVVLDDVVLHSDPSRKKAVLRSLAELAQRTQVIAFSHDPQVVALAQASVHSDLLKVHEFGDGEITGELQSEIAKADVHSIPLDRAA
jgi:uncharacterized protein YhaN